jgi:hypothetical protein
VRVDQKLGFTLAERATAGAALAIEVLIVLNWTVWGQPLMGLSAKQLGSVTSVFLAFLFVVMLERSKARNCE